MMPPGEHMLTYRAEVGGQPQPFRLYVPAIARRRYPLVLCLSGFGGGCWDWSPTDRRWADALGVVLAGPYGWGNQHWDGLGEDDVLRVRREVAARLPIDADRVYLHGGSMGGHGALRLAWRHPHLFAGTSAVAGWISGEQWYAKWYAAPGEWRPPPAIAQLVEAASPCAWRQQARFVATRLAFGTADDVNEPEDTEWLLASLAEQGLLDGRRVVAERVPGGGHGAGGAWPRVLRFLLRQRRRWPTAHHSPNLRHADLGWVRVDRRPDPLATVSIEAAWRDGRAELRLTNAAEVVLQPAFAPPPLRRGFALTINGTDHGSVASGATARLALTAAPSSLAKRRGADGGPGELFRAPFGVLMPVRGAQRAAAEAFAADWQAWFGGPVAQAAVPGPSGHLVVWGDEHDHPWLRRWTEWPEPLGVRPWPDGIEIDGQRFAAARFGWQVLHPLPWQPERLVLLCRGYQRSPVDAEQTPWAVGKDLESLPWRAPDVVVFDPRVEPRLSVQPPLRVLSDAWVLAGTFDAAWRHLLVS